MSITTTLGKRKRSAPKVSVSSKRALPSPEKPEQQDRSSSEKDQQDEEQEDITAIFRRAFEAKFAPLDPALQLPAQQEKDESDSLPSEDDASWSGFSRDSSPEEITAPDLPSTTPLTGREKRAFMSSRLPTSSDAAPSSTSQKNKKPTPSDPDEESSEKLNLANDLALQRLLKESHLLSSPSSSALSGKTRLKALELRMADLGAKTSVLAQKDMPLSHRKGIERKKRLREEERRREAKENGIVLEREKRADKGKERGRRDRGVDAPGVGRFEGGVLRLSRGDVEGIQGRGGRGGRSARGRGRGRGRR
ncbi:hypothetical protein BDZ85DRAFT_248037 [Elsinoe ampelina]|uniref:Uncharacterized protein n=1 Tax=Elsinoe ampelina TaxID=302913 RepID=A0A6A6GKK1_9PEZI|nr:hypothetical protein BDZ85DRAFT_248037 [Elsinoe ampelina]